MAALRGATLRIFDLLEGDDFIAIKKKLQIRYVRNMEFFKSCNLPLFNSLKQEPREYNLLLDRGVLDITRISDNSTVYGNQMVSSHKNLSIDPSMHPKYKLHLSMHRNLRNNAIDEKKLAVTGRIYNNILMGAHADDSQERYASEKGGVQQTTQNDLEGAKSQTTGEHGLEPPYDQTQKCIAQHGSADDGEGSLPGIDATRGSVDRDTDMYAGESVDAKTDMAMNVRKRLRKDRFLPCSAFYGLFSGIFLQAIVENGYRFFSLIIYEENVDMFRISLYFVDYERLFENTSRRACLIVIKDVHKDLISTFLHSKRLLNNVVLLELKQLTTKNADSMQNLIFKERQIALRGWGSFEDELVGVENSIKNLKSCNILRKPKRVNAPICVVGNGPSLDMNIDFLRAYRDRMVIFSCGTALKVLNRHGVKPDFQIEIERVPYLKSVLEDANLQGTPLIHAQVVDPQAAQLAKERYCFIRNGSASSRMDPELKAVEFSSPFVGNAGFSLAALMGSDVIMCGLDCGYIRGFGKHAKHSFYGDESKELPPGCFRVNGTQHHEVYSNDLFMLSLRHIENAIRFYKVNVINVGFGASIQGSTNLLPSQFELKNIDKAEAIKQIKSGFRPYETRAKLPLPDMIERFSSELKEALSREETKDIMGVYNTIDTVNSLLQRYVANPIIGGMSVLFEGSVLHLCYAMLLRSFCMDLGRGAWAFEGSLAAFFDDVQQRLRGCGCL